jgi:hypothetical protein
MPIVTISIALRAKSPAKQGSRQKTLTFTLHPGIVLSISNTHQSHLTSMMSRDKMKKLLCQDHSYEAFHIAQDDPSLV